MFNAVKLKILSPPAGLLKQRALLRGGRSYAESAYAESLRPPRRTVRAGRAGTRLWNSMEFHIPCFFLWNFHIPCFLMELEWNQPLLYTVYTTLVLMWDFVTSCTVSTRLVGVVDKAERRTINGKAKLWHMHSCQTCVRLLLVVI